MAVRFLPPPEGPHLAAGRPGDLAEVIDLRSRLPRNSGAGADVSEPAEPVVSAEPAESADRADSAGRAVEGPRRSGFDDAVRLLARRSRSSGEVRDELRALGHETDEVEAAVAECAERLYLDDLGLGRVLAERLRARAGASRVQIRRKLRERRLEEAAIEAVLAEIDDEAEQESLRAAAEQRAEKLRGLDRVTAERRLLGFLARRGWSGEAAVRAARSALEGNESSEGVRFR